MTTSADLDALYQERLLRHYRSPRHRGTLEPPRQEGRVRNPACGDEVEVHLRVEAGRVAALRFRGEGCAISQASASMMAQVVEGRTVEEAQALARRFAALLKGDAEAAADPALGDLRALAGVARFPLRIRCALLAFEALGQALGRTFGAPPDEPPDQLPAGPPPARAQRPIDPQGPKEAP
jgi:nitrogen fixation NifU-like protein